MQMFRVLEFLRIRDSKNTLLWKQVSSFSHRNYFQCVTLSSVQHCNVITYNVKNVDENWSNGASVFVWVNIWAKWGHIIRAYSSVWQNENLEMQLCKMYTTRNFIEVRLQKVCEVVCICTHSNVHVYLFCVCQHVFANVSCTHDRWSKYDCTEQ